MDQPGPSLLPALRPHFDSDELARLIQLGLSTKKEVHPAEGHAMMIQLGG